jgi:DNA invertase Pin-like site-specific DNA recombinase
MDWFLYARVSMDEIGTKDEKDEREQNPDAQILPMRAEVARRHDKNVGEFIDRDTGQDIYRPDFKRMLELAAQKKADGIMVARADRFSRFDPLDALLVVSELQKRGIHFLSLGEPFASSLPDNPVPDDIRIWLLHWSFLNAKGEARRISERTKAGIAAKRAAGEWKGGRPKGSQDKQPRQSPRFKPELTPSDMFKPS